MQEDNRFSNNLALKMFLYSLIPLLHLNLNIAISVEYQKKHDRQINAITIIYLLQYYPDYFPNPLAQ